MSEDQTEAERPEASPVSQPAPPSDGPGSVPAPGLVDFLAYVAAIRPILDLIGVTPEAIFADGFEVTEAHVKYVSVVPVHGVDAVAIGDIPEHAEWGWPVTVEVDRP